jgi:hypothetical protein
MKMMKPLLSLCLAVLALSFASRASAQQIAYDEADYYVVNANWTNGANQGFGFVPWTILTNGPDFHGNYINSLNSPTFVIATTTNVLGTNYNDVWGLFANGTNGINITTAFRGFTNSLSTNTFKLQWGSRGAGSTATTGGTVHGWCGFSLRNGNATNSASDFQTGVQLYLYFLDGNSPSTLYYWDGNGVQSVPNTSFSNLGRGNITNAIEAEVTPATDGTTYHLVLKDCVNNSVLFVTNGILMNPGQTIDSAALFCYETTGDQIYNKIQITGSRNILPTISNVQPLDGSIYLTAASVVPSFEVDSFNSTVSSSSVKIYLNGIQQSGLTFNTTSPTTQLLVTNTTAILPDTFYNYAVVATDAYGNTVSNSYTFNTFLPTDIYIDAYDYNDGAGQFINNNTPVNAYANLLGTNFEDYQIADLTGTNNTAGYRPGDLVEILSLPTDTTGDPIDHANLRANGHTAYNIGFTDVGNWEDYTRVYPATNYTIYARAASSGSGQFEVERLATNAVASTNQPLIPLGRVNVPPTGGSLVYSGQLQPVVDIYGNTVIMPLSGTNTLRETALGSRTYNLEYFAIVANPVTNVLRPYISTGSPSPGTTGVALNTGISLTVANRQTSIITNTVQLILNSTNISSRLTISSNLVGATISWSPTNSLPSNFTNTLTLIFTDSSGTSITNTWNFFSGTTGGLLGNGVWSGAGGPNDMFWSDAINWTGSTPGPGFSASFTSAGATTTLMTNNIVATNVTILQLNYETNSSGYHTTWIQNGVTLTVTNGSTATGTQAIQVGGAGNGTDNSFSGFVTNTITGLGGTLLVEGNPLGSGLNNSLNIQVRQNATAAPARLVTFDMSGLGTLSAVVGKFYVAQGGSGANQTNVSGWCLLARTNIIYCIRPANAGTFEVGDSSGGAFTLPGSALYLGITNSLYSDNFRIGKQKATNNLVCFNPAFTNGMTPAVLIRDTNGPSSYVTFWSIGDADTEVTTPDFVQANCDFSGGKVDALVNSMVLARGSTSASDSGSAVGTLTFTAGTMIINNLTNGVQRANNTTTETGNVNVNGGTLISTNLILAQLASGGTASLVTGSLNITNGTVAGNIVAGGGVSTVNLNGGTLVISNSLGASAARVSALNLVGGTLHLKVNGSAPAANVNVAAITASGGGIAIDSVANVTGPTLIHLISYTGSDPFSGLSLASMPSGYTGTLVDNAGSIDVNVNVGSPVSPTIKNILIINGQIIVRGTNNVGSGGTFHLLTSTNVTLPLASWPVLSTGSFDGSGNFSITNGSETNRQQFYIMKVP